MGIPHEIIRVGQGKIVEDKSPSQSTRETMADSVFEACLGKVGLEAPELRNFCFKKLGFKKRGNGNINAPRAAALFLLSESRCPIDGLKLVPSDIPESTKDICPRHQFGFRGNETGEAVIQHPSPALLSIEAEFLYPNMEGLSVIKERMQPKEE